MCYVHAYTQPCHQTTKDQHQTIPCTETCRQTGIPFVPLLIKQIGRRLDQVENWFLQPAVRIRKPQVHPRSKIYDGVWTADDSPYVYIYIYTLGAGGSPKVLWVGYCEWLKIVISLWRNVSFWRSHSLHRIVFCADEIFLIRVLIDQKSIIHTFIFVRNVWFVW